MKVLCFSWPGMEILSNTKSKVATYKYFNITVEFIWSYLTKNLILNRKNATSQDFVKMAFMCQFLAFHEKSQRKESKFPFFDQRASSCLSSRIHTDVEFSAYDVNIVSLFQLKCNVVIKEFKVLLKVTTLRPNVY